ETGSNDGESKFADSAPKTDRMVTKGLGAPASGDDDLVFTDEVGGKAVAAPPKETAPNPKLGLGSSGVFPPGTGAPASGPSGPPSPGTATGSRARGSAGSATRSSDRIKALGASGAAPALEPPSRTKRNPGASAFPEAAAPLEPPRKRSPGSSWIPDGGPA